MVGSRDWLGGVRSTVTRLVVGAATTASVLSAGLIAASGASATPSVTTTTEVLTSVSCVKGHCVVVGSTNLSGGAAIIAHSKNSGATWTLQKAPSGVEVLNEVYCITTTSCKSVGETSGNAPVIVTSPVSGGTWVSETAPAADGELLAVTCSTATDCWAGGYSSGFVSGAIAETTDGGTTWSPESVPGGATGVQEVTGFACKGTAPAHCFATGNWSNYGQAPYLMKSTSLVKTWSDVALPKPNGVPGTLEGAYCFSAKSCIFVGNDPSYFILTTTTGGTSFTIKTAPSGVTGLTSISCSGKTDCTAVGTASGGVAAIIRSTNGGKTWSAQSAPTGTGSLSSVSCMSTTNCVAVGQKSAGGPAVVVTSDGGTVWSSVTAPV